MMVTQIEWLKSHIAKLQLPPTKRDHDTREKFLLDCGMPAAAVPDLDDLVSRMGWWGAKRKPPRGMDTLPADCRDAAEALTTLRVRVKELEDALKRWQSYGCPDCGGDCGSANPPVMSCIMQATRATLLKGAAS